MAPKAEKATEAFLPNLIAMAKKKVKKDKKKKGDTRTMSNDMRNEEDGETAQGCQ